MDGLPSIPGPKNAKLYNADSLMRAVYLGRDFYVWRFEQSLEAEETAAG